MPNERKIAVLKALGWIIKIVPQNYGATEYFCFESVPPYFEKFKNCTDETVWAHQIEVGGFDTDVTDDAAYLHLLMTEGAAFANKKRYSFVVYHDVEGSWFCTIEYEVAGKGLFVGHGPDPATAIESALHQIIQEEGK